MQRLHQNSTANLTNQAVRRRESIGIGNCCTRMGVNVYLASRQKYGGRVVLWGWKDLFKKKGRKKVCKGAQVRGKLNHRNAMFRAVQDGHTTNSPLSFLCLKKHSGVKKKSNEKQQFLAKPSTQGRCTLCVFTASKSTLNTLSMTLSLLSRKTHN